MATAQIANTATNIVRPRRQYRVSIRGNWTDPWDVTHYLEPLRATVCAAPDMPRAAFRYRSGTIKREDDDQFRQFLLLDVRDLFVKIELLGEGGNLSKKQTLWVGVFVDTGVDAGGNDSGPRADEELVALGIEHLLNRSDVRGSWVVNPGSGTPVFTDTALDFNQDLQWGLTEIGNRSDSTLGGPAYVFGDDGVVWTAKDVAEYLVGYFKPSGMTITLGGGGLTALASLKLPRVRAAGQSAYALLNQVIDRRRGLGWWLDATAANGTVELKVFTTVGQDVAVGSARVPANNDQVTLDLDTLDGLGGGVVAGEARFELDTMSAYDRIVIAGERMQTMFTLSPGDTNLTAGWTVAEQNEYKAGSTASGATAEQNDAERKTEKHRHVYTTFKIPKTWDLKAGNGQGGTKAAVNPYLDTLAAIRNNRQSDQRTWGLRLLRALPLKKPATAGTLTPEFRDPMAFIYDESKSAWRSVDSETFADDVTGSLRMLDDEQGVEVRMNPAHLLGKGQWTEVSPAPAASAKSPKYDYQKLVVTVALELDARPSVFVDLKQGLGAIDPTRTLFIEVPNAHLWYCTPGTVTDIEKGQLKSATAAELRTAQGLPANTADQVLRDDGPYLRQIAALAKAWYGKDRAVLRLPFRAVVTGYVPGVYILATTSKWDVQEINAPVTSIEWDLEAGDTLLQTHYGELDVTVFEAGQKHHRLPH